MHPTFASDGTNLTPYDVAQAAHSSGGRVEMAPAAQERIKRSRAVVDGVVSRGEVVYGITTGFGAFKDRVIPPKELAQLQVNLILSQCVGVGPAFPEEVVRAMMLCRAHTLALGYSGIRLETLQLLYNMLNMGVHPLIPEQGSVGASGDLAPLSHMALTMLGLGQAEWHGELMPSAQALSAAGLEPCVLAPKEGLALSNGTSLMTALLSLAVVDAAILCDTADVVGAMSLEALQGVPTAFDPRIHAARGQQGQIASAANILALIEGSSLLDFGGPEGHQNPKSTRVQDAYSLRCMPQVHGSARDTVSYVNGIVTIELNSANDNPLVFPDGEPDEEKATSNGKSKIQNRQSKILSGGNFHGAPISVASDFLGIGICQLANISERRQARLVDTAAHGGLFPAFLIEHGGLNSGFMMVQYTSAALASENKSLAHPASVDTIPTSANIEDHVSMGPIAGRHARAINANTARVLALEAMMAAQALDFRIRAEPKAQRAPRMGKGTRAAYNLIRQHVPFLEKDVNFQPHIAAMEKLVLSGALATVASDLTQSRSHSLA